MRSRPKKKKLAPVDPALARKLEAFGRLAAFLDTYDGQPLDGIIAYFNKGMPMGINELEREAIQRGYDAAALTQGINQS